jgi:hypothetical protein
MVYFWGRHQRAMEPSYVVNYGFTLGDFERISMHCVELGSKKRVLGKQTAHS